MEPLNPWYQYTYDAIVGLDCWKVFEEDPALKVALVFSWMPMAIMNVNGAGGVMRSALFDLNDLNEALRHGQPHFSRLAELSLESAVLEDCKDDIVACMEPLARVLGTVATSKYLHFSQPRFFPMWDSSLRRSGQHEDTPAGYFQYMLGFKHDLELPSLRDQALGEYPSNAVRGLDIVRMRKRK